MVYRSQSSCKGRIHLSCEWSIIGKDISVLVYGGEKPDHAHIGAVATAWPDKNIPEKIISSVITLPKHREDELARDIATTLCRQFRVTVTVICGIHIPNITSHEIEQTIALTWDLVEKTIPCLRQFFALRGQEKNTFFLEKREKF